MSVNTGFRSNTPAMTSTLHGGSQADSANTSNSFNLITQNLLNLGSIPIERLAESPKADLEGFDLPFLTSHNALPHTSSSPLESSVVHKEELPPFSTMQHVAQLHQTCQQSFGNSEALKYEFLEEHGPSRKQCILTISRPNGMSRSYTTKAEYNRKSDAKARAATIAVDMGAIDFIRYGSKDSSKALKKLVLAPLDGKLAKKPEGDTNDMELDVVEEEDDELSKQIKSCCIEWRAGRVKPRWILLNEHKGGTKFGYVLCIELSPHSQRVYSVNTSFEKRADAKKDCARMALVQGVLEFIKYGNGQTVPAIPALQEDTGDESSTDSKSRPKTMTLQAFYETLPKPMPESVGDKIASEINAPGWLNTAMQAAKGARLSNHFHWITDGKAGVHGCVLRLERPEESKSYMVNPMFSKRADAKAAVCMQAMSQGIGEYIRSVAAAVDNKVTPEMRKKANEQILPVMGSEYSKLRQGIHPMYEWSMDRGAFGCSLTLALSSEPRPEEVRKWTVPIEFRTKNDAKIAVVCRAADDGAIEFIRFRGEPPPPGYDALKLFRREEGELARKWKKKNEKTAEDRPIDDRDLQMPTNGRPKRSIPLLETKEEAMARKSIEAHRLPKHEGRGNRAAYHKPTWIQPFVTGPVPHASPSWAPGSNPFSSPSQNYDVAAAATEVIDRLTGNGPSPPPAHHRISPAPTPVDDRGHSDRAQTPYEPPYYQDSHYFTQHQYTPLLARNPGPFPPNNYSHHDSHPSAYYAMAPYPPYHLPLLRVPHADGLHEPLDYQLHDYGYRAAQGPSPPMNPQDPYRLHPTRHAPATPTQHSSSIVDRDVTADIPGISRPKRARPSSVDRNVEEGSHKRVRTASLEQTVTVANIAKTSPKEAKASMTSKSASEPVSKSHVKTLLDYCAKEGVQRPDFFHQSSTNEQGETFYKVWVIQGKERLELPTTFSSVNQGQERLAKKVIQHLRAKNF